MLPVVIQAGTLIQGLINDIGGSSTNAVKAQVDSWVAQILAAPSSSLAQGLIVRIKCWSGDQSVITPQNTAELFGGGPLAAGCGVGTQEGRDYCKAALVRIRNAIGPALAGPINPSPIPATGGGSQPLGGVQVGIPVPASTAINATIGGVPVWAILGIIGIIVLAAIFGGGRRR